MVERRSRVHVEVWAHGEKLHILNRFWATTEEFLKAPCDTFTTIGKCRNLDTQGQRATKEKCGQSIVQGGREDPGARLMELEAAVGRGMSKSGVVTISGLGVWTRKANFRSPLRIGALNFERRPSSAARQLKVARPQPRSPTPRTDPEGQFVYISDGRDRENNDRDLS